MTTAIQLLSILVSSLALMTSIASLAITLGMKWSTHKVEWKAMEFDKFEEDESPTKAEEDAEILLEKAFNLQREAKKKRLEDPLDSISETSNF